MNCPGYFEMLYVFHFFIDQPIGIIWIFEIVGYPQQIAEVESLG